MSLNQFVNLVFRNLSRLLVNTFSSIILIFLLLFVFYPVTYQAVVTILPPEKNNQYSLGNILQGSDFSSLMSGTSSATAQLYVEILKSRTASYFTASKLALKEFYSLESDIEAAEKLSKSIITDITKEGVVKLSVPVSTPIIGRFSDSNERVRQLSVDISNSLVESLDSINRQKIYSKARNARLYIESELLRTKKSLDSVEAELIKFQSKNKAISLNDQVKASIEAAAKLKSEITATEINFNLLSQNLQQNNSIMEATKSRLSELKRQYEKLESNSSDILVSFSSAPNLGIELTNLMREIKVKNEVYILLQQQYYKEKIQENRDVPTVEILDSAILPSKASSPRLVLWSFSGGFIVFLLSLIIIISKEQKIKKYLN
ncbi:MAG: hypothetical protein KF721_08710 [Ignavibacteriaceae bacterium]|nr:hypothetical protein [Ignavibacteriaceae bacterium]